MSIKRILVVLLVSLLSVGIFSQETYVPTVENLQSRKEFEDCRLGVFIHWGIYSMFGQGEWYLQTGKLNATEYSKVASAFYPINFNADVWARAIAESGAGYVTFTTRHHDGFSMWSTQSSDYNIMEATPFQRDIVKELSRACEENGLRFHLYYSLLDWTRDDYPQGRTGHCTGRDSMKADWPHYRTFMKNQLTELLTDYGKIGAIWFDGYWDHDEDSVPFNWEMDTLYTLIHRLQPACLVANNSHVNILLGEDIQIFERDVPGENTAGYSGDMEISHLPLETCQTMNNSWGYRIKDQEYKSTKEIIQLLVNTAGRGANLLLNIGPQPNGELPFTALMRLKDIGAWMKQYGESIRGTKAGDIAPTEWGATTRKGDVLYLHVLNHTQNILLPPNLKVKSMISLTDGVAMDYKRVKEGTIIAIPKFDCLDYVIAVNLK